MRRNKHIGFKHLSIVSTILIVLCLTIALFILQSLRTNNDIDNTYAVGEAIDSLNHVYVFYNGEIAHVKERNTSPDGYNIGLKWQCVEFVKRYYYVHFNHLMPDATGNAKDIFNTDLPDASYNVSRALVQYTNASVMAPAVDDILVFDGHLGNKYGHIAIISKVYDDKIEIIQQNAGPDAPSREEIKMLLVDGKWKVMNRRVLGWMRIE